MTHPRVLSAVILSSNQKAGRPASSRFAKAYRRFCSCFRDLADGIGGFSDLQSMAARRVDSMPAGFGSHSLGVRQSLRPVAAPRQMSIHRRTVQAALSSPFSAPLVSPGSLREAVKKLRHDRSLFRDH